MTQAAYHHITTTGNPVKVPPRRIPAHYHQKVNQLIQDILHQGIIKESSSPWMAPAVIVRKKSGDIRLCIDYRELNKQITKDAYPLPLPDEVQDHLAGSTIFSTLDLQSGYWQMPVCEQDLEKTVFCPGAGMVLFQFFRMPFGLTGAPGSFQHLMDKILQGLPYVNIYLDNIFVHSANKQQHKQHLRTVFNHLRQVGLTLKGKKCCIGISKVCYLGHIFSVSGMAPDHTKIKSVCDWPVPTTVQAVCQFLDLASYYCRYIHKLADIAGPLYQLTQKVITFKWTSACNRAFCTLKEWFTQAPILVYPQFHHNASKFTLQTDASA